MVTISCTVSYMKYNIQWFNGFLIRKEIIKVCLRYIQYKTKY